MRISGVFKFSFLCVALNAAQVLAEPAVIFDMGGKFDKSFNEAANTGIQKWSKETGKKFLEFEISNESQREQAIRRMAEKARAPLLVLVLPRLLASKKSPKNFPSSSSPLLTWW